MLLAAALLLAAPLAPAPAEVTAQPVEPIVVGRACQTQVIRTDLPRARLDRPVQGGVEAKPYQGESVYLVSAVERTVGGCPVPVIRVRAGEDGKAPAGIGGPIETKAR